MSAAVLTRVRRELRDLIEVVLLPGLAAVLPWKLCFRMFRIAARWDWLYREVTHRSLAEAQARGWVGEPHAWKAQRRLVTLVDHADLYLTITRGDRWMARHLDVQGDWQRDPGPQLLFTFHWGAGNWGLRNIRASGLQGHMLVAQPPRAHFAARRIFLRYILRRIRSVGEALGHPPLDPVLDLRQIVAVLRDGDQIVAAIDVPSDQVSASLPVTVAGQRALMPRGLLKTAVEKEVPVTVFLTGIDLESGRRFLRIHPLGVRSAVEPLADEVFAYLDRAIREAPAAWHFWSEAQRFFRAEEAG